MTIIELANKFSKIPGLKKILKPFYYRYKRYVNNCQISVFKKNGLRVIENFDKVMTEANYPYFLIFGSMLGAFRDHGLIKHDLDFDTGVWFDAVDGNLLPVLEKNGFRLVHSFEVCEGKIGREWTLQKDGVTIDIFFIYPPVRKNPYCCDFPHNYKQTGCVSWNQLVRKYGGVQPRRVELPFSRKLKRVQFETMKLPIPENAEEILKIHYGHNFMTPIANWTRDEDDIASHLVMWDGMLAEYKEFH